eukprot:50164_1
MLSLVHHAVGHSYRMLQRHRRTKLVIQFLYRLHRWICKKLKYFVSFLFISRYRRGQQVKLLILLLAFCLFRQFRKHRIFYSGIIDTSKLALFYLKTFRQIKFRKTVIRSKDTEKYSIWSPAAQTAWTSSASYMRIPKVTTLPQCQHIWVCLPGGMLNVDPAMVALFEDDVFEGSELVCFNNPGVSTEMASKPLISPTEPKYLIEYLEDLSDQGYKMSLIGFSVGTVWALRTLHALKNDKKYADCNVHLECVILVHAPDLIRDAVQSSTNYWIFRHDLFFACYIHFLQQKSKSWNKIKDKVNYQWFEGWQYIKQCTEICCGDDWQTCEDQQFNLRTFCDESITDVPVVRIIAKNDFVIPFNAIDPKYFKYLHKVLITERGGHCGVHACKETRDEIKTWNQRILNNAL